MFHHKLSTKGASDPKIQCSLVWILTKITCQPKELFLECKELVYSYNKKSSVFGQTSCYQLPHLQRYELTSSLNFGQVMGGHDTDKPTVQKHRCAQLCIKQDLNKCIHTQNNSLSTCRLTIMMQLITSQLRM